MLREQLLREEIGGAAGILMKRADRDRPAIGLVVDAREIVARCGKECRPEGRVDRNAAREHRRAAWDAWRELTQKLDIGNGELADHLPRILMVQLEAVDEAERHG